MSNLDLIRHREKFFKDAETFLGSQEQISTNIVYVITSLCQLAEKHIKGKHRGSDRKQAIKQALRKKLNATDLPEPVLDAHIEGVFRACIGGLKPASKMMRIFRALCMLV